MSRRWEVRSDGTRYAVNVRPSRRTERRKEKRAAVTEAKALKRAEADR